MAGLIVTTAVAPSPEMESRARAVAARCGGSYVCRARAVGALMRVHAADMAYVVACEREEVRDENEHLYVHRGLLATKLSIGARHPFARALGRNVPGKALDYLVAAAREPKKIRGPCSEH